MGADRSALLAGIRSFRQEILQEVNRMLDRFEDELLAACESHPEPVQVKSPANDDWMTVKQVCEELNISDSTFYGWINAGLLPEGVAFGPRSKRWKMSDIRAWQKSKTHDAEERPKTITRRRGRVSRIRKIGDLSRV